jgi:hypothetical protein
MFISGDRRRAQTESFCNVGATSTGFIRLVVNKQYFSGHDVSFTTLLQKYTLLKITTGRGKPKVGVQNGVVQIGQERLHRQIVRRKTGT